MIIYPIIILALLLFAFAIVWRRAYLLETKGQVVGQSQGDKTSKVSFLVMEPEANLQRELEPNFQKAEDLFKKKQYISAEKWYLEVVKKDPKNSKVYSRLGTIYLDQRNFEDAKEAFKESIRLDDRVASRFFNLSYVYNALGDLREASNYAKRALRLDPTNTKYRRWLEELRRGNI